jgi:Membrane proteins related to metalloendopeptidases
MENENMDYQPNQMQLAMNTSKNLKTIVIFIVSNIVVISIVGIASVVIFSIVGWFSIQENVGKYTPPEIISMYESSPLLPPYVITEEYGHYTGDLAHRGGHYGIDMSGGYGAKILSVLSGTVTYAHTGCIVGDTFCGGQYGNYITIQHFLDDGTPLYTRYAHLDTVNVVIGQKVERGEVIGLQGNSGFSTGTHLHFEVRIADNFDRNDTRNPREYFEL